jgi:hypothetical protein
MAAAITAREFKLLLKPELFPTKRSVLEFNNRLAKIAKEAGVEYDQFDRVDSEMREVQFFDTADAIFRRNHVILRLRRDHSSGWPDETFEVTFKRRCSDFREAADFNTDTSMKEVTVKKKFKEEILPGDKPGTIRSIFSNNLIGYYPVITFEQPMSRIIEVFPGLKALDLDPSQSVSRVGSARVVEIGARLGMFDFGKNTSAHVDLAVWMRPLADAMNWLVAEFGWSYHIKGDVSKHQKAYETADEYFKYLQESFAGDRFEGSTKTALIYGVAEA